MPESPRPPAKPPTRPTAVRSPAPGGKAGAGGKSAAPPLGRGARRPPAPPRRSSGERARLTFAVLGVIVVLSMTFGLVAVGSGLNFGQGSQGDAPSPRPGSNLVPTYEARLRDNPNDVNTMTVLANVLQNQGDYQGAINWYEKAVAIKPDDVDLRLVFGQALYSYGQLFDAEVQYKKAIELDGKNAR